MSYGDQAAYRLILRYGGLCLYTSRIFCAMYTQLFLRLTFCLHIIGVILYFIFLFFQFNSTVQKLY